jgi:EAL domain-containing protein (putative c-di-GMP-specific phosphodiesterase class I)
VITLARQTIHDHKANAAAVAGEVLARWQLQGGRVVGPAEMSAATGMGWGEIDEHITRAVLHSPLLMSGVQPLFINISDETLSSCILMANYCSALAEITSAYGGKVVVEVPETSPISGHELDACIAKIINAGAVVAIDDFGVSYSDMSRLDQHEWSYCKLALPALATTPTLDWLISLQQKCRDRGIQVVCEQVERFSDLELIRVFPNAWVQGFAYSMPEIVGNYASDFGYDKCSNF